MGTRLVSVSRAGWVLESLNGEFFTFLFALCDKWLDQSANGGSVSHRLLFSATLALAIIGLIKGQNDFKSRSTASNGV